MDEKLSELVSAWLDGELRRGERRRGARELARRAEARERLGRYRLIGEALRGARRTPADPGFARSVAAAVERERPPGGRARPARPGRLRFPRWRPAPVLAFGAAAALAVGLWLERGRLDPAAAPAVAEAPAPAAAARPLPPLRDYRDYLAAHAEYAASPMMMPYAQLLDYAE